MTDLSASRTWLDRPLWGVWLTILGVFLLASGIVLEKMLLSVYQVPQMAFIRASIRLVPLLISLARLKEFKGVLASQQTGAHLIRLLAYVGYTYCILYALSNSSLAMIGTFQYITPFFTMGFGAWILKETMSRTKWIAIGISTLGVLVAMPPAGALSAMALLIVFASVLGSLNQIMIRRLTATEHSLAITIYGNVGLMLATLPLAFYDWRPVHWEDMVYFVFSGILAATAQYLSAHALRFAEASTLASLHCTSIVWGVLFDFFFWQVIPNSYLLLGAGIIIASNIFIIKSSKTAQD